MKLHADLSQPAMVDTTTLDWVPSPLPGVDRRMIERDGEEVARATTVVKYDAESFFSPHSHSGGEEYYVLEGTFSDESGDYPAGYYVRNPVGSSHKPFTKSGCRIFVKLQQMQEQDQTYVATNTFDAKHFADSGIQTTLLHQYLSETVLIRSLEAGQQYIEACDTGLEIFVLAGSLTVDQQDLSTEHWIRLPGDQSVSISATESSRLLIKKNHL